MKKGEKPDLDFSPFIIIEESYLQRFSHTLLYIELI